MTHQTITIAEAPASLLQLCQQPTKPQRDGFIAAPATGGMFQTGRRNTDMTSIAGSLRRKGAGQELITMLLSTINHTLSEPLDTSEINRIAHSIAKYDVSPDDLTHDELAKLFSGRYLDKVRYCVGRGFFCHDGKRWKHDAEGLKVLGLMRELVDAINADIQTWGSKLDPAQYDKLKKAGKKLKSADFMSKTIKLVKSEEALSAAFGDFDRDKNLINFPNGTYDRQAGALRPHMATDKLTHMLDFDYDPAADCPAFKKLLTDILPEDKAALALRLFGYALTGTGREQMFFIFHGKGKNGKSTLLQIVSEVFGELAVNVQPETLNGKMDGHIRNDLARLPGKRLMTTNETRAGSLLDAPLLKQITGLDTLSARFLHKEYFEFQPVCVPIITSNHLPVFDGSDFAMERRICLISFDRIIEHADKDLPHKLRAEKAGIFNLILAGLADYQQHGLAIPPSVQERTRTFVERSNLLKGFYQDRLEPAPDRSIKALTLYRLYGAWCCENGYKPMSINQFKDAFERETGLEQARNSEGRHWPSLRLK